MGNHISYTTTEHTLDLGSRGQAKGVQFGDKARRYAAVPYALPPTGQYRWRKPRPLPQEYVYKGPDDTPYDATAFRLACPQQGRVEGVAQSSNPAQWSEDCLVVNIWTPVEKPGETNKWPVMIWFHGGWFQIGNPSQDADQDPTEMISTGGLNAIVVAVGYRLNIFGFLAGHALLEESHGEAAGNFGLWDQRLAIEWVYDNIGLFGGDVSNITLSGRSAGSYSVEAQILHEFRANKTNTPEQLIHRFFMSSNAIPAQPKTVGDVEAQFDEVCNYFKLPSSLSGVEKLQGLREVAYGDLLAAIPHLEHHTFRPVTDDLFFHSGMIGYLTSGNFATEVKKRGMKVLIGEVAHEETLYAQYNAPSQANADNLKLQVLNYYAPATTEKILAQYQLPETDDLSDWKTAFGKIIADGQIRAPSRLFVDELHKHGVPVSDIWRYRIDYRMSFITEKIAPLSWGVSHAFDKPLWNFSVLHGPTDKERDMMKSWIQNLIALVQNDESFRFGTTRIDEVKVLTAQGDIEVQEDAKYASLLKLGWAFASA